MRQDKPPPSPGDVSAAGTQQSWWCQGMVGPQAGTASWGGCRHTLCARRAGGRERPFATRLWEVEGHRYPAGELKRTCHEMGLFLWGIHTPGLSRGCCGRRQPVRAQAPAAGRGDRCYSSPASGNQAPSGGDTSFLEQPACPKAARASA